MRDRGLTMLETTAVVTSAQGENRTDIPQGLLPLDCRGIARQR